MKETLTQKLKTIPFKTWVLCTCYYLAVYGLYRLGDLISRLAGAYDHAWCPKIPAIDDLIPVVPVFTVIYLFSYVFWICGLVAITRTSKKNQVNYLVGHILACVVGFAIFAIAPTYMDRTAEGLYEIAARPGAFNFVLRCIHFFDGQEKAFDLFPSYHCLNSVVCYLGIRKQPEISKGFKIYTIIMAALVCISCVLVKQHYFLDIIGGVGIALICYVIAEKADLSRWILKEKKE